MLSSFQARNLRVGDRVSIATPSGTHVGKVLSAPHSLTTLSVPSVRVILDCIGCVQEHPLEVQAYRLIAAERTP
jgi:hypothetical protein